MTRRIQYRGDLDDEWASYGPDTKAIASAFVRGINAWVAIARERPPEEFVLAGWAPELWRPEDLLNRTDAFLASGDAQAEVFRARLVAAVGARARGRAARQRRAGRRPARPRSGDDHVPGRAMSLREIGTPPFFTALAAPVDRRVGQQRLGDRRTHDRRPARRSLATDPHRLLANPSLRYLVHLTRPGLERRRRHRAVAAGRGHRPQRSRRVGHDGVRRRHGRISTSSG